MGRGHSPRRLEHHFQRLASSEVAQVSDQQRAIGANEFRREWCLVIREILVGIHAIRDNRDFGGWDAFFDDALAQRLSYGHNMTGTAQERPIKTQHCPLEPTGA